MARSGAAACSHNKDDHVPEIQIELEASDVVSYASTHNHRPFIQKLSLVNPTGYAFSDLIVQVSLASLGTPLAESWERAVPNLGAAGISWLDIAPKLDANVLHEFHDQFPAQIVVTVSQAGVELASLKRDITTLAANAWMWESPIGDFALMLPAFVMPNHPALTKIREMASKRLTKAGFESAIYGYAPDGTDDGARVLATVRAIYESVRDLGMTYVYPLTSWDMDDDEGRPIGQRIRTPGEVVDDRAGTCLDTSVLFASMLENIGLKPVIAIVPGHAFVGYWRADREDYTFGETVGPIVQFVNFVDANALVMFETTTVCGGADSSDFDAALERGRQNLVNPRILVPDNPRAVFVDVARARYHDRVLSLPARVVHADGSVEIVEYKPEALSLNLLTDAITNQGGGMRIGLATDMAPARVRAWKNSLLDLSLRNPLINYRSPASSSLTLFPPPATLGTLEDLLQSGIELSLRANPMVDGAGKATTANARGGLDTNLNEELTSLLVSERAVLTNATEDTFITRVRRIASIAKSVREDTGNNNLFLALGSLVWQPEGKGEVRSPLILIPVNLKSYNRSKEFRLVIDEGSAVTPNYSLAEKLLQDVNFRLPKLIEPDLDDAGIDIDGLLDYVRTEITNAKLQGFRVDETCTLGFFDFSTYRLWRDLSDHWPTLINAPLVRHLVETPQLEFTNAASPGDLGTDLDDLAALLPVETDGSQVLAVAKAMAGQTFVLQGPPGTGKSQTITNLLARALHSGKRVLFIAEKPPALNVVKDRLTKVGLAPFILNLHDKSLRPAQVREQLLAVLEAAVTPDREGYEAAQSDLNRSLPALQRYPLRVHNRGKFGESAYSARNKLLAASGQSMLPVPGSFLTAANPETKAQVTAALRETADTGTNAGTARENRWSLSELGASKLTPEASAQIVTTVGEIYSKDQALRQTDVGRAFLSSIESLTEISYLGGLAQPGMPTLAVIDSASGEAAQQSRTQLVAMLTRLNTNPYPAFIGYTSGAAPVEEFRAALEAARKSFFIGRGKKVDAVAARIRPHLAADLAPDQSLESVLDVLAAVRTETAATTSHALSIAGLTVPGGWNPLTDSDRAEVSLALEWIEFWTALLGIDPSPARARLRTLVSASDPQTLSTAARLGIACKRFVQFIAVNETSESLWATGTSIPQAWADSIDFWHRDATDRGLTRLQRWGTLLDTIQTVRDAGLTEIAHAIMSGEVSYLDAEAAFERGFLQAVFLRQLDDESLDTFDGPTHDIFVRTFGRATESERRATPGILGADLIQNRGFDSNVTIGAVGELTRELRKTRGGKAIRKLLMEHWKVISRLTPCVLASPDSVVRFLDASLEPFDIVVFDEASQIRVPHAIGALGRARAAVVVGDSKQMPPTSVAELAQAIDEDDETEGAEAIVVDEESILSESVQARVQDVLLSWHYRSEDETLIAFSNQQYYDGRLSSFPAASNTLTDKGLSFVRVQGQFDRSSAAPIRGTNPQEAQAIVDEIVRRLHDPELSKFSIGVVTFNKPQQGLIISSLQALGDDLVDTAMSDDADEGILVKNLEDVQGQERDVILFSVAFSRTMGANGPGALPLNFGPLNRSGGERRLNVAVTRARKQIIVFCSFEPSDLKVEGSSSVGLRHLRSYLELAKFGPEASGAVSSQLVRAPDRHREEIVTALRDRGLVCETEVGLSDFKVDIAILDPDDPSRRLLGILLDGEAWRSRTTVGDRDSLPAQLLTGKMGWPDIERIWMPTWVRDREGEIQRIFDATEAARVAPQRSPQIAIVESVPAPPALIESLVPRVAPIAQAATTQPWPVVPSWIPWNPRKVGETWYLDQLSDPRVIDIIHSTVLEIVSTEGPISPSRYTRQIGLAFDLQRVSAKRSEEMLAVPLGTITRDRDGFLFIADSGPGTHSTWRSSSPGSGREIADISLTEIGNAMRDIARVGLGMSEDELSRVTAQAFGISRITVGIRERLANAANDAVARQILVLRGDHFEAL
jgi:hypothetical protein